MRENLESAAPDAVLTGASGWLNIPFGKFPGGLNGVAGIDVLVSLKTGRSATYAFEGGGLTFGNSVTSGGIQGSLGFVFNTPTSQNYTGYFWTISIPYTSLPSDLQAVVGRYLGKPEDTNVSIFFDPTGGGSAGISLSRTALQSKGAASNITVTSTYYYQIIPSDDQAVPFR